MFKIISVCFMATLANAGDYQGANSLGLGFGSGLGYGLGSGLGSGLGYDTGLGNGHGISDSGIGNGLALNAGLGGLGLGGGLGSGLGAPGPVTAAIQSRRTFEVRPVNLPQEPAVPQVIDVGPSEQPVQVIFRSISSPVHVQQIHSPGAPGRVDSTQSEDQPHRVVHEVLRPVIQEVREVIQPYRRVVQEVRPVVEEVHTIVAKGDRHYSGASVLTGSYGNGLGQGLGLGGTIQSGAGAGYAKYMRAA